MSATVGSRTRSVRLDVGQYLALWRHLGLGERPVVLATLDHGRTYAERDALDAAAWRRLGAQGLLDAGGRPDPLLADTLAVLARPTRSVDAAVVMAGEAGAAGEAGDDVRCTLAAERGGLGVVAALLDGELRLDPADPYDLPGSLLGHVPSAAPAVGSPMSLPAAALLGPGLTLDERAHRLRRAGVPPHQVDRLRAMWARPPLRTTVLGATARDGLGVPRRAPRVITVVDTVTGRVSFDNDAHGHRVVVRPAGREPLRAALRALLHGHERAIA